MCATGSATMKSLFKHFRAAVCTKGRSHLLHSAKLCYALLCYAVVCCATLYYAVLCYITVWYTMLCMLCWVML